MQKVVGSSPIIRFEEIPAALLEWASTQNLDTDACRFLSAFVSRTGQPFRQLVAALAWGTHVWFLDEPEHVMRLEDLPERADA